MLDKHILTNFLCYGSLWGEIRMSRLFPWSEKAEICILNDQLSHIKTEDFLHLFKENKLNIKYIGREGYYFVENDDESATFRPFVEIYVFAKDKAVKSKLFFPKTINLMDFNVELSIFQQNVYKRIGWHRRILPPDCDWTPSLHCFPTHLVDDLPLSKRRLGKYMYSVPKGGVDLQKYHYAENWWLDIKVKNC